MSEDSYFCFCCLSTDDLCSLFDNKHELISADLLKELFGIIHSEETTQNGNVCTDCIKRMKQLFDFKQQVLKSIDTMQDLGLITVNRIEGKLIIQKVKTTRDNVICSTNENHGKQNNNEMKIVRKSEDKNSEIKITVTQVKNNKLENIEVTKNSEIIRSFLSNDPVKKLERDNNIPLVQDKYLCEVTKDLKCRICMKRLPNVYAFNMHMNRHFPNYICEECGRGFINEKRLKRHKYCHNSGPFVCQDCEVKFHNYSTYDGHRKRKHSSTPYLSCGRCPEQFTTYTQRARHLYTQHDVAPKYKCTQCASRFITSGLLNTHMRYKHEKQKRYNCEVCGAGFFYRVDLIGHTASHAGRNPYKCHLCSKSYIRKKALTVHLKLHNDDKRFSCDVCGRSFLQKCTLITHIKIHNRVKKKYANVTKFTTVEDNKNKENDDNEVNVIKIEIEPLVVDLQSQID